MYNLGHSQMAYWVTLKAKQYPGFKAFIESEIWTSTNAEKRCKCVFWDNDRAIWFILGSREKETVFVWDCLGLRLQSWYRWEFRTTKNSLLISRKDAKSTDRHTKRNVCVLHERSQHCEMVPFPPIKILNILHIFKGITKTSLLELTLFKWSSAPMCSSAAKSAKVCRR